MHQLKRKRDVFEKPSFQRDVRTKLTPKEPIIQLPPVYIKFNFFSQNSQDEIDNKKFKKSIPRTTFVRTLNPQIVNATSNKVLMNLLEKEQKNRKGKII